jgi:hypothetical protein
MKSTRNDKSEELVEQTIFSVQFKGKCRNCVQIGHKLFQCKNRSNHNGGNHHKTTAENYNCQPYKMFCGLLRYAM